ncbi:phosphogluconate dehydrogenase (NAD(+)-dependent, decarboxylating) [Roseomonas indoligenes]|uniref:Decarboxylating 6-phosphogluconate dehydrogenase n=1 Tax=Roseomonas indoligenes TaxID=2820811 RepID=A0A940MVJ0_9PROT|nr:decarboxylating 6-phosphogluconate dehydrogenase [Pararoseomonas indoligenes]MBP0494224.1 decarboxylating 6-phosphogluconate dehydrogenase [Pararoseomonas indoligenes]
MRIGIVGLGRMGANIARRLMRAGHATTVWDLSAEAVAALAGEGAQGAADLAELVAGLEAPRTVWVMLPAGTPTEATLETLSGLLSPGDCVIEGGNSNWQDSVRRAKAMREKGIDYLDVGTSGGVWGLERGYCLMIGGPAAQVERLDPIFAALAPGEGTALPTPNRSGDPRPPQGYVHAGPNGAGHYSKMVHNGIEYGMMQAFAEGFDLMRAANEMHGLEMPLPDIAEAWRRGSVVASWLLDLTAQALAGDPDLSNYAGRVGDSGEGRWTVQEAVATATPAPVLTAALYARFRSRQEASYADRMLSAMRHGFGGHVEPPKAG